MGIVLRQSLSNSFSSYAGLAIGALNTLVLYPLAFMPEHTAYYGLVQLLLNYTLIISMFTGLGMPQVLIRFYKRLEESVRGHLTFFALLVPLFILLPLATAILLFREPLAHWLTQNPEDELLLFRYFPLLTITVLFNVYFEVLASISQVHLRSVLPMFLKEVGRRSVVTVLIGLLLMDWIDLHSFIWLFALLYPIQLIVLAFVLLRRKRIQFSWGWRPLPLRSLLDFGLFSFLTVGGDLLLNRIDQLMIAKYVDLEHLAYYTIAFFIGNVINIPQRASAGIVKPLVVGHLENQRWEELREIYRTSSAGLMVASGLLMVLIIPNLPQLLELLPVSIVGGTTVVVLIASGKFLSSSLGLNSMILSMSSYYRFTLMINVGMIVATVLTNLWLIPRYGIAGAAGATLLVIVLNNIWKTTFVGLKLKLWPFSRSFFWILPWVALCTSVSLLFTQWAIDPWWGIPLRSLLCGSVFLTPVLLFRAVPVLNEWLNGWRK
jgi:O-antigen/teichoic acid export membrane protein